MPPSGEAADRRPSIVEDFRKPVVNILGRNTRPTFSGDPSPVRGGRLPGRQDALYASGGRCSSETDQAADSFRRSAGELANIDFGEVDVTFLDGAIHRIHFFASRLIVTPDLYASVW